MKKITGILVFSSIAFLSLVSLASAQTAYFNVSLSFGSTNTAEVLKLQQFLYDQGYLHVAPTGNFLSLTQKAVSEFQKANNVVPAQGYFGPLTRAVANSMLETPVAKASISPGTISNNTDYTGSVILSSSKTVKWSTTNYPEGVGVNINLIRKISDSPISYTLVRVLADNTPNDGSEIWTVKSGETTNDLYVEITCSTAYKYKSGCQIEGAPIKVN